MLICLVLAIFYTLQMRSNGILHALMNLHERQFIMILNRLIQGICFILHNHNSIVGNLFFDGCYFCNVKYSVKDIIMYNVSN